MHACATSLSEEMPAAHLRTVPSRVIGAQFMAEFVRPASARGHSDLSEAGAGGGRWSEIVAVAALLMGSMAVSS